MEEPILVEPPDFPDPRSDQSNSDPEVGLSIDAILQRTHLSKQRANSLVETGAQERFVALEAAEDALNDKERDLIQLRAEIIERERVVRETEILLAARERLLDDREALLSTRQNDVPEDQSIVVLEKSLEDTREALGSANDALAEKEDFITALRTEIEGLKSAPPATEADGNLPLPTSLDSIPHPSLADQVAFLREREAFIEQSENTLFDKAQALQEWETRLQQNEHDQTSMETVPPPDELQKPVDHNLESAPVAEEA